MVIAAALLLGGIGSRIVDNYKGMADPNTIAAVSLAMSGVPAGALPVTVLDIDDKTREAGSARSKVPHAALARLIGIAAAGGASAIIVDIDLSGDAGTGTRRTLNWHALLAGYPADGPVLMLARRIVFSAGPDGRMEAASSIATPYDGLVRGKANIHWITTLNDIDRDRTVRRIRLWQSVCAKDESAAYPSAPLVAGAFLLPSRARRFRFRGSSRIARRVIAARRRRPRCRGRAQGSGGNIALCVSRQGRCTCAVPHQAKRQGHDRAAADLCRADREGRRVRRPRLRARSTAIPLRAGWF